MERRRAGHSGGGISGGRRPKIQVDGVLRLALIFLGFTLPLALLVGFFWILGKIFLVFFAGVLLAIALRGLADWLSARTGLGHGWSLTVVVVVLASLFGVAFWAMAPAVGVEMDQLIRQIPRAVYQLERTIEQYEWGEQLLEQMPTGQEILAANREIWNWFPDYFTTAVGGLVTLILVLFVGLYLAAEPGMYLGGFLRLLPMRARPRGAQVLGAVGLILRRWLLGRAFAMVLVGILTTGGLWFLGVPMPLALGFMAFLLELVPNIGPLIASVPAILIAFLISPELAGLVILLYLVIQTVEAYFLTPMVQRYTAALPPVITLLVQVFMAVIFGVLGLLLATPLAAMAIVLIKMLYIQQALGEEVELYQGHDLLIGEEGPETGKEALTGVEKVGSH